jgi:parallel beta-helix repeat protein
VDETIIGNHISNTAGSGIYLAGVNGGKVADNTITDTTLQQDGTSLPAAGIALNGSDNIHILGNIIQRSGRCGIAISTTQDITIEGNQIRDISTWAIHLRGAQVRTAVNKNVIDGASIGISIASDTSSTTLEGNVQTRVKQPMKDLSVH